MGPTQVLWISEQPALPADWPHHPAVWNIEILPADEAIETLAVADYAAIVLDLPLAGWTAATLLEAVQRAAPGVPVLARDPKASISDAVQLAHLGIHLFLPAGESGFGLIDQVIEDRRRGNLARLAAHVNREDWERMLVGAGREMRLLQHTIRLVAGRRATVLITGETGTGKELGARSLHMAGNRRSGPMVAVNCSALPESLMESELFGHVRGAFTGAFQNRMGRFEQAQGGDALSGRNRRAAHRPAEQTAARPAGAGGAAAGQFGDHQDGHTGGGGHELRSGAADGGRQVSRRSLLPSECGAHRDAAFAEAARRCTAAGCPFRGLSLPDGGDSGEVVDARDAGAVVRLLVAGKCPATGEHGGNGSRAERRPAHFGARGFPSPGAIGGAADE